MDNNMQEMMGHIKAKIIEEAKQMREVNKIVPISGERRVISLDNREVNIVYYKVKRSNAPLLIGFHGGGFLFGGNALNDGMWDVLRNKLDVNVASVEYRKSPEYMYKEALDDAYDTAVYLKEHSAEYGFDKENISVFGCSAGGTLASTVCLYAKEKGGITFKNQVLMYPFLDSYTDPMSKGRGSLEGPIMYIFNEMHCKPEESRNPLVSPVFAEVEMLKDLPKAIFCYAENDNLQAEARQYAQMLCKAGVEVADMLAEKMPHGYFETGFGQVTEAEYQFLGEEVVSMVKDGTISRLSNESLEFVAKEFKI